MEINKTFLTLGGDIRQAYMMEYLAEEGYSVKAALMERAELNALKHCETWRSGIESAKYIVLPLPAFSNGVCLTTPLSENSVELGELVKALQPGQWVLGGMFSEETRNKLLETGASVFDYYNREELNVLNAIPTAEGALKIAMEELPVTIHGTKTLIVGFGRVGKLCASRFCAMGSNVVVAARSEKDHAWLNAMGLKGIHTDSLATEVGGFDIIINTVPVVLLDAKVLGRVQKTCLIIDLASKPGGMDFGAASQLGLKAVWALSLPGKVAPKTAGRMIGKTICNILKEHV